MTQDPPINQAAPLTAAEFIRRRRTKNIAIGAAIAFVYVLFFIITIVRMGGN
jgi:hypothetical protein